MILGLFSDLDGPVLPSAKPPVFVLALAGAVALAPVSLSATMGDGRGDGPIVLLAPTDFNSWKSNEESTVEVLNQWEGCPVENTILPGWITISPTRLLLA
jgi:hypothetical protein